MALFGVFLLILLLVGCSNVTPTPTITDMSEYLIMSRCPDGTPAVIKNCSGAMPQKASDPMLYRRWDWSGHTDQQISDAYISDDGLSYITTFSYPPHETFNAVNGDGGDVFAIDGNNVRISFTQNGAPGGGTIAGYWVGANCGGSGWFSFDSFTPSGSWASKIAYLAGSVDPNACPKLNPAYTRWRLEDVSIPFIVNGVEQQITLPTIITEHYGGSSITNAAAMERSLYSKGYGRVIWEAWSTTPTSPMVWNCPGVPIWSDAPKNGWYLQDRRCLTQIKPTDAPISGDTFAWPKK